MLSYRIATLSDTDLLYQWAIDPEARKNSYSQGNISLQEHVSWLREKVASETCEIYIFQNEDKDNIGQVRIERSDMSEAVISISVDKSHRRKGYATEMLKLASQAYLKMYPKISILAFIFLDNQASLKSFLGAGFISEKQQIIQNIPSLILSKSKDVGRNKNR